MNSIDSETPTNALNHLIRLFCETDSNVLHPNIFIFINVFKEVQTSTYIAMHGVQEIKKYLQLFVFVLNQKHNIILSNI